MQTDDAKKTATAQAYVLVMAVGFAGLILLAVLNRKNLEF